LLAVARKGNSTQAQADQMRTCPEIYASRAEAEHALWKMASDGRVDRTHDRRLHALVLFATFASLRWGEATAR
jgi:hypothetical protein